MDPNTAPDINQLIARFADLHENWESDPAAFDWTLLQSLAREGALAYNEHAGPSFHSLALDGVEHDNFHERFLAFSIDAGFDPFRLIKPEPPMTALPVMAHDSLARAARSNPSSAAMHQSLEQLARDRFEPMIRQAGSPAAASSDLYEVFQVYAESVPADLLRQLEPELAKSAKGPVRARSSNPEEGRLSSAESIIDSQRPYG